MSKLCLRIWIETSGLILRVGARDRKITCGPNFDQINPLLELMGDHEGKLLGDWL